MARRCTTSISTSNIRLRCLYPTCTWIRRGIELRNRLTGANPITEGMALRLLKAQYGLKQAGQLWNKEISGFMTSQGFTRAGCGSSLYYYYYNADTKDVIMCILKVDDLCLCGSNDAAIETFRAALSKKYGDKFLVALTSHGVRCLHAWASGSSTIAQRASSPWTLNKRLLTFSKTILGWKISRSTGLHSRRRVVHRALHRRLSKDMYAETS